jgi:PEP-CTERM motif
MHKKFKDSKRSSTALTVGATSLASLMAFGQAKATQCVPNPITAPGGSSISSPTSLIDSHCTFTEISVAFQGLPAYWEFSWDQVPDPVNISSVGSFFSGDAPTLALYDATDGNTLVASDEESGGDGFFSGSLGDVVLAPDDYIIGVLPAMGENEAGSFNINFEPVPEPATLGLFGGALAALATFIRKRRKPLA